MLSLILLTMMMNDDIFVRGSFEEIKEAAKESDKLIMMDVYTDWCGPCKTMDRTTFRDEKVKELVDQRYIAYKVNAEKGEGIKIAQQYKVPGYPCIIILDANGREVDRALGFIPAKVFAKFLKDNM